MSSKWSRSLCINYIEPVGIDREERFIQIETTDGGMGQDQPDEMDSHAILLCTRGD